MLSSRYTHSMTALQKIPKYLILIKFSKSPLLFCIDLLLHTVVNEHLLSHLMKCIAFLKAFQNPMLTQLLY